MNKYVPGCGNSSAKLMIVGEAPGASEEDQGVPFVGPSGQIVDEMLDGANIKRSECWITNVIKYRPPQNDLKRLKEIGVDFDVEVEKLWVEIKEINPNCILALGNTALLALTGKTGIQNYRGSILPSKHHYPKVIPSLHPAGLLHQQDSEINAYSAKVYIQFDFRRAVEQSKFKEINTPRRKLWVCKNSGELYDFLRRHESYDTFAFDIEVIRSIPVCIGISFRPQEAVSVQLINLKFGKNPIAPHQLVLMWQELAKLLEDDRKKIAQNGKFDIESLRQLGFRINNYYYDCMLGMAVLNPELPKSLAFQTSIYTEEPYYKDDGKDFNLKKDKFEDFQIYNARDAAVELEVGLEQIKELEESSLSKFYFEFVHHLHKLYSDLERVGIGRDETKVKELKTKFETEKTFLQTCIDTLIGHAVNVNSPKQMNKLLYEELKLPRRKDTSADTLVALLNNAVKNSEHKKLIINILQLRRVSKVLGTYLNAEPDFDGRWRTSYKIVGTETGRTSTSILKPPIRPNKCGLAFQTLSKHGEVGEELRQVFRADPGFVFIEADQSQAEARVVAILADDLDMLKLFDELDIHKLTASWIFQCDQNSVGKNERNIGKMTRHAGNYNAGKRELMRRVETIAQKFKLDIRISEWRAGVCLEVFHKKSPKIRGIFHEQIKQALEKDRKLVNPFGRLRTFYGRWDEDLFKEGYAQIPQSTVSDQTKKAMLECRSLRPDLQILLESHDAFLTQVRIGEEKDTIKMIRQALERPIDFRGCTLARDIDLIIPCEVQIGDNWGEMIKYKL